MYVFLWNAEEYSRNIKQHKMEILYNVKNKYLKILQYKYNAGVNVPI